MRLRRKLTSRRGETLTETLVALLMVGVSSAVLASMLAAASRLNATAIRQDETLYNAVTVTEKTVNAATDTGSVSVKVGEGAGQKEVSMPVTYYTDKDGEGNAIGTLYSYRYSK